ncbi:MAG TPA: acyl-protein synthetase [Polyangiaceae bacterium]|nr:acyl-protein synthetase [Polyangiaceae bacterium]
MSVVDESEALHARVRAFAAAAPQREAFEALALEIAEYQARYNPGFARLVRARGGGLASVDAIPAVPSDAFRLTRVATYPQELDVARFATSGTTGSERGIHPFRTTATYEELATMFGRRALVAGNTRYTAVALAPRLDAPPSSSLGFMMALFMRDFDGRPLTQPSEPFDFRASDRWLLSEAGPDVRGLERAAQIATNRREPLLLLATSFALVALLDALASRALPLPPGSVVMQTGGYKGRTREVPAAELRASLARCFDLREDAIVSEYGMTELSSQLYEGTLPGASLSGQRGVYLEPAWLRVTPVHPVTLEPVADGEPGLARFVDLANVDSAVAMITRDLVRRRDGGVELLGRAEGAPPRGCSLAVEALLAGK